MELPTPIHIFYIPAIFILGLVTGWVLRSRARVIKDDYDED